MKKFNYMFLLFAIYVSISAQAIVNSVCDNQISVKIQKKMKTFKVIYNTFDSQYGKIKIQNESVYLPGTNGKAMIIQHGFMGSPFEVLSVVNYFNLLGYSVYAPLLFGFGSTAKVANSISRQNWRNDFSENVIIIKECYKKVTLIGFSIGATLASDYAYKNASEINNIVLISPFFGLNFKNLKIINRELLLFTNEISVKSVYMLSSNTALKAFINYPQFYNQSFPLKSVNEVIKLGKQMQNLYNNTIENNQNSINIPCFTITSQDDKTINLNLASKLPNALFRSSEMLQILKYHHVPHQILLPEYNPFLKEILKVISFFIEEKNALD